MPQGQACPSSVTAPILPSLGLTILEVACNMELPHGGEGWQQLRQGYVPPEFTAGKCRARVGRNMRPQGGQAHFGGPSAQSSVTPDTAVPCGQACLLSCVLSSP